MRALVLWDVDQTLLRTGPLGREIYDAAFLAATGRRLTERAEMAGRTDRQIAADLFAAHGLPADEGRFAALFAALGEGYRRRRTELGRRGVALPGAAETLAALAAEPGVVQSVVTGNVATVAAVKLGALGLAGPLELGVGGYGDEPGERCELVRRAIARAEWAHAAAGAVLVVGDTVHDVTAARLAGAVPVGVASGPAGVEVLRAAGAEHVLGDLTNPAALVALLPCSGQDRQRR